MDPTTTVVTEEIVKGVVAQIKHQFSYLSQFHNNIRNLCSKVDALKSKRQRVEERVEEARRNSLEIEGDVNRWLERVEFINKAADEILEDKAKVGNGCWKGWCLNLKLRYQLSRKVVKEALPELDKLLTEVDQFVTVAKPQLPLGVVYVPTCSSEIQQANQPVEIQGDENSENSASYTAAQHVPEGISSSSAGIHGGLESRLLILGNVMEAVKDNQIRIVRICGMGGVGKTTMVKEVEKMARDQFLFHEIVMVEFNQEPDLKRVQLHMAERLGLELKEDDVKARAARIHDRLNGKRPNDGGANKRILVILDNVWRREDLEETGIPLGDEQRFKILLTSRQDDVCKNIATEKEFKIEVLSNPEATILFRQSLGNSPCYDEIAEELVKACAGLPISIKTIARAVSNKKEVEWKVALRKLKKSALEGEYPAVFNCLKVSYDFLKNEEIKKFFQLCCLFHKGSEVPIEDLARYGIALRLFKDTDKLYEAREEAHRNVETLLNSNLLLSSDQKECVKMHDQVWDFTVRCSSTCLFMVNYSDGLKEWPRRDSYEDYTSISLLCSEMDEVLEGRNCPNLELLQLTGNRGNLSLKFQEDFFEGMVGLNVLAFRIMNVPLTPKSLQLLTTLRTLSLCVCSLGDDVSMIGNLGKLEVLSFAYSNIKELPTELGKLRGLRLLDLTWCDKLHKIAPGVLSSLISLEELYMRSTPLCHGDKVQATFTEIASLSKLVVIDIEIPIEVLPMDSLFEKLEKFKISINKYKGSGAEYLFPNSLDLICDLSIMLQDGIKFLVQETERMYLNVTGLKTLLDSSETWDFSKLKSLSLVSCNELVYLINSVRKIEFRNLKYLSLQDLPNLVGFCKACDAVEFPQLEELKLYGLPLLTRLHPETETSASGHSYASSSNPFFNQKGLLPICRFPNLRSLKVSSCSRLRHLSTPSTFGELQHLEVQSCESLQAIVVAEEREKEDSAIGGILLPKLNHLHLKDLPNLSTIVPKGYTLGLSSLKKLVARNCGGESDLFANTNNVQKGTTEREIALTSLEELTIEETNSTELWCNHFPCGFSYKLRAMYMCTWDTLSVLFSPHLIRGFQHLEKLSVLFCESLEVVFDLEELIVGGRDHKVPMLSKLDYISLLGLRSMTHVWKKVPKNLEGGFHNLTRLSVTYCDGLMYLFSLSIAKCLVKLRDVEIKDCQVMEEVVSERDEEEGQQNAVDIIFFPQLQELRLFKLPSLECFGPAGACSAFDKLSLEAPNVGSIDKIAKTSVDDMEIRGVNSSFGTNGFSYRLRKMVVESCNKLSVLFPPHLVQGFPRLEELNIYRCDSVEVVFDLQELTVGGRHKIVMLNWLAEMTLEFLPRMAHVWKNVPKDCDGFHNLTTLNVRDCDGLRYLFSPLIAKCLVRLRKLSIGQCKKMEEVVSSEIRDEEGEAQEINLFPELHELELEYLPSLLICLGPVPTPAGGNYNFDKQLSFGAPRNNVGTDDQGNASSSTSTHILNQKGLHPICRFPNLRSLKVISCTRLRHLSTPSNFGELQYLKVHSCESLQAIVAVEEIEEEDSAIRGILLPKLNHLHLKDLPNLSTIVPKGYTFRWSSLKKLVLQNCGGESDLFANTNNIQKGTTEREIALTSLEELTIEETNSTELWRNHFPCGFSYKLRAMYTCSWDTLSVLFLPHLIRGFHHLEKLSVLFCESLEVVFDLEELIVGGRDHKVPMLSKLDYISLLGLRSMTHVWKKVPKNLEGGFHNLTHLSVRYCDGLMYLFSLSIAKCLVKLRDVEIKDCQVMEEVVTERDEEEGQQNAVDIVFFPQLQELRLFKLPSLKCFGPAGACSAFDKLSLEAPNVGSTDKIAKISVGDMEIRGANSKFGTSGFSYRLRKMVLESCNKLSVLFPPHLVQGFPRLEELNIYRCDSVEVVFDIQELTVGGRHKIVMFNWLAEMTLEFLPSMAHVWKNVPKDFDGFHNLTTLNVRDCDGLRYLFSPLIAKCLVRLRKLSIGQCKKMEEVVSSEIRDEEGEVQEINLFPELHELELEYLPSLLICLGPVPILAGGNYNFDKQLSFGAPPNNVGTDDQGNASSSTSTHILNQKSSNPPSSALVGIGRCQLPAWSLHNLTRLEVYACDKLLYLFSTHMVVRLPVLQSLSIVYCDSLRYLFCSSTATSLVQLRDLNIYGCEMMEVIVKDEDEVEVDRIGKLIVFSSLISVKLRRLSNFKGFCLEVLCFEWPLLTLVEIELCWKMGIFTYGYSNTPILDGVFINSHKHSLEGDLNATLMSMQQKDNFALKEEGILTSNGFFIAGEHLVAQCPSWSWHLAEPWTSASYLPNDRSFLITRNVPCLRRASSKVVVEDKNEGDDKNIPRPRSYDVSITYNEDHKSPRLWLRGYDDDESKMILPLELVLQDIAEHHPRKLVTIERHPHLYENRVSLYPHLQPNFIKDLYDHRALQGIQPNIENYLQILLEAYASVVPTIKYRYC